MTFVDKFLFWASIQLVEIITGNKMTWDHNFCTHFVFTINCGDCWESRGLQLHKTHVIQSVAMNEKKLPDARKLLEGEVVFQATMVSDCSMLL